MVTRLSLMWMKKGIKEEEGISDKNDGQRAALPGAVGGEERRRGNVKAKKKKVETRGSRRRVLVVNVPKRTGRWLRPRRTDEAVGPAV